jgi:hypothetical protein
MADLKTDRDELEKRFHREMVSVYQEAKKRHGYNATRFLQIVSEKGGLQAAKELLRVPGTSEGLSRLYQLGALDISMEARIAHDPTWAPLFSADEIDLARKKLAELDYEPPAKQKK